MNNGPSIITCPKCKVRVLPRLDGTCPSCQAVIAARVNIPQKPVKIQPPPPETSTLVLEPARVPQAVSRQAVRKAKFLFWDTLFNALKVTWKFKMLWILPMLAGIVSLAYLIILFMQTGLAQVGQLLETPGLVTSNMAANFPILILLVFLTGFLGIITRITMVLGVKMVDTGGRQPKIGALVRASLKYFWRILGLMIVLSLGMGVVFSPLICLFVFGVSYFRAAQSIMTDVWIFFVLTIPLYLLIVGVLQYSVSALLLEGCSINQAVERAWELVTRNKKVTFLLALAISGSQLLLVFIINLPFSAILLRLTGVPGSDGVDSPSFLFYVLACLFFCAYAFCQGILSVYNESAWTLSFLRLTGSPSRLKHALSPDA